LFVTSRQQNLIELRRQAVRRSFFFYASPRPQQFSQADKKLDALSARMS
jgi:hypothetical protein